MPLHSLPISLRRGAHPVTRTRNVEVADESLMVRYQRGERATYHRLVERHLGEAHTFCVHLLQNPSLAERAVELAFRDLVRHAAEFQHEHHFRSWFYRYVVSACRQTGLDAPNDRDAFDVAAGSATCAPPNSPAQAATAQIISALPVPHREVFLLKHLVGLTQAQISDLTGLPLPEVRARILGTLQLLQTVVAVTDEYARAMR